MNIKKLLMVGLFAIGASFLVACSGDDSPGSSAGAGGESELLSAYNKINQGMSPAQVTSIVGFASNAGGSEVLGKISYRWAAGNANLDVQFSSGGANRKIFSGLVNGTPVGSSIVWSF